MPTSIRQALGVDAGDKVAFELHDDGQVTVSSTEEFLRNYMEEFRTFIERVLTVLPREE